ncbi:Choline transport system permease protein OpuBB [Polaromonas vacuolata]|uniref:Choline transport system permease protein OpuBB n=1 Tax=Polaromonas vacuolata TaxID=37448 RepID=A0A6H2HE47_9BURK|nr:ABC transporter permease [Polaromonas vacuolata]QJC57736.1 Choline transport system permease protein OpuBB [Polaromonas vacuolata]
MLLETWQYLMEHPDRFSDALLTHVQLSISALLLAAMLCFPAAIVAVRRERLALGFVNVANVLRTLPSLALLALLMPLLGTGFAPSLFALTLIALPPLLTHSITGLRGVDADLVDAAIGMGMTRRELLFKLQLPLALPTLFAGLRTAAVQVISGAVLASFIGGGGLGDFITAGIAGMSMAQLLVGAIPVALMALLADYFFGALQRLMTSPGLRA